MTNTSRLSVWFQTYRDALLWTFLFGFLCGASSGGGGGVGAGVGLTGKYSLLRGTWPRDMGCVDATGMGDVAPPGAGGGPPWNGSIRAFGSFAGPYDLVNSLPPPGGGGGGPPAV